MEIERKFLIDRFPDLICKETAEIYQGYVNVNPEVRVRSYAYEGYIDYLLSIKGEGNLSREEVEVYIDENTFTSIVDMIGKPLIHKQYKIYEIQGGLVLECCRVDTGVESEFMYAEVEFTSEDEALKFLPPFYLGREVTHDDAYKMKNYWARTRC